ncbi:unnamed protein product [Paramecium pentaurelia]|uniref:Transmembrane protein n=1 Tax=Paramecium pentaurelia TaxID=43138 RepID=A0A8S1YIF9_9CILI|nr:unnamed protein product [Paramecium pentaurelia]
MFLQYYSENVTNTTEPTLSLDIIITYLIILQIHFNLADLINQQTNLMIRSYISDFRNFQKILISIYIIIVQERIKFINLILIYSMYSFSVFIQCQNKLMNQVKFFIFQLKGQYPVILLDLITIQFNFKLSLF